MRNQRRECDFGLDHYIAVASGDLRVGGPSVQRRCPSNPFGLWQRWSPEFGQCVKLDPDLTRKDICHGYPT